MRSKTVLPPPAPPAPSQQLQDRQAAQEKAAADAQALEAERKRQIAASASQELVSKQNSELQGQFRSRSRQQPGAPGQSTGLRF